MRASRLSCEPYTPTGFSDRVRACVRACVHRPRRPPHLRPIRNQYDVLSAHLYSAKAYLRPSSGRPWKTETFSRSIVMFNYSFQRYFVAVYSVVLMIGTGSENGQNSDRERCKVSNSPQIVTDHVSREREAIGNVRPSVRPSVCFHSCWAHSMGP